MKITYIIFLLVFLLLFKPSFANCQPDITIYYDAVTLVDDYPYLLSEYKYPDCREDDKLTIQSIQIKNNVNCTFPEAILKIKLYDRNKQERRFCDIIIPSIEPEDGHLITSNDLKEPNETYVGGIKYECMHILDSVGDWSITTEVKIKGDDGYVYDDIKHSINRREFKVHSKLELELIKLQEEAMILAVKIAILSAFLTALFTGLTENYIRNYIENKKEKKRKKDAIKLLIYEIEKNIDSEKQIIIRKKKLLKENKIPFKDFTTLNLTKIITGNYIEEPKILKNLMDEYEVFVVLNNYLSRSRVIHKPTEDMHNIFKMIELHIPRLKILIKDLEKYIKSI